MYGLAVESYMSKQRLGSLELETVPKLLPSIAFCGQGRAAEF
jgi:hypothetical protein